jgi:hypothetical protein
VEQQVVSSPLLRMAAVSPASGSTAVKEEDLFALFLFLLGSFLLLLRTYV